MQEKELKKYFLSLDKERQKSLKLYVKSGIKNVIISNLEYLKTLYKSLDNHNTNVEFTNSEITKTLDELKRLDEARQSGKYLTFAAEMLYKDYLSDDFGDEFDFQVYSTEDVYETTDSDGIRQQMSDMVTLKRTSDPFKYKVSFYVDEIEGVYVKTTEGMNLDAGQAVVEYSDEYDYSDGKVLNHYVVETSDVTPIDLLKFYFGGYEAKYLI